MAVETAARHERLLDDVRNDIADAGFLPDDENAGWVEPRAQAKKLIEAHRGLRDETEKQKNQASILLMTLLGIIALNIASLFR
jgi:hypothetical protein